MMKLKKIGALVLAAAMLPAAGCGRVEAAPVHEAQTVHSYTFDKLGKNVMPVGGYIGPFGGYGYNGTYMESLITEEQYQTVADCGLNFLIGMKQDYNLNREETIASLELADDHEIMLFIKDSYLYDLSASYRAPVSKADFEERVKLYSDYGSFAGLVGRDEPFGFELPNCQAVQQRFDEVFQKESSTALYMNSLSYQCPEDWLAGGPNGVISEKWDLDKYMEEYFKAMSGMKFYSYDTYPFVNGGIRGTYFENLQLVRDITSEAGIPFWTFIQGGGYFDNDPGWDHPTEGGLLWQVSTSLAYGAKGYQYFPYCHPAEFTQAPTGGSSLIGRYGEKTATWFYAQKANRKTQAVDHILMNSAHMGVISNGQSPAGIPEGSTIESFRELTKVSGADSIVGCFDYAGKTALYVVNNSVTQDKAKVTLEFTGNYGYEVIQRATSRDLSGKSITLTFAPGEGALVVLK